MVRCIYKFGMYAAHALYIRPPYAIESRWPQRVRGMYAAHVRHLRREYARVKFS